MRATTRCFVVYAQVVVGACAKHGPEFIENLVERVSLVGVLLIEWIADFDKPL